MTSNIRVPPVGPTDAEIILVGEAPANEEINYKPPTPFVGSAGEHLNRFLLMAGLFRGELYITNILKHQAPGNKITRVSPEILHMGQLELIAEINALPNPKILVALGDYALKTLTDKSGITNFRGSVLHPKDSIKHDCIVIPTFHPSIMHYNYNVWPLIVADLMRVKSLKDKDFQFEFPTYNFILRPNLDRIIKTLEMLQELNPPIVVIDVETPHALLSCIGLAWSRQDSISIPFYMGNGSNYWTLSEEMIIWEKLAEVLPELNLAGQNVLFDWEVMHDHKIHLKMPKWDSMLMHACLYSELPHNLETIVSIYTDIAFYKRDEDEDTKRSSIRAGKERDHWEYNMLDCVSTLWAIEELIEELTEENMMNVYISLFAEVIEPIFQMNMRGIRTDSERLPELRKDLVKVIEAKEKIIHEEAGYELNVKSHKQVKKLLYEDFGWQPYIDRKTKKKTTNKNALENLAYKYQSEIPTLILEAREDYSFLSIFSDDNIEDGRFRCDYNLRTTNSGRFSSKKKATTGKGRNLQNVKRGPTRAFFLPEIGDVMVGGDMKQADMRIVAYLSDDENYIKAAESGRIYFETGREVFGEEISKDDKRYTIIKGLIHGTDYGMGPFGFAHEANISFADAKIYQDRFLTKFPGIRGRFYKHVEDCIRKDRTLYNVFGRRQIFFGRINESLFKAGYSFIPQSSVGDINKIALKRIYKHYIVLLEQHDGLILSVPEGEVKYGIEALQEAYDVTFKIWDIKRKIPISISVGENWSDMEEVIL